MQKSIRSFRQHTRTQTQSIQSQMSLMLFHCVLCTSHKRECVCSISKQSNSQELDSFRLARIQQAQKEASTVTMLQSAKQNKKGNIIQTSTAWAEGIKPAVVTALASNMDRWPQTGVGLKQPWCWVAKIWTKQIRATQNTNAVIVKLMVDGNWYWSNTMQTMLIFCCLG